MNIESLKKTPAVRWAARILSIIPIYFFTAVVFTEEILDAPWLEWLTVGMLGISALSLALAWRWERLGGWASAITLLIFVVLFLVSNKNPFPALVINILLVGIPAALFLVGSYRED